MTNNFKNNLRNNTSFKTRTCLVSLSISLVLAGVAIADTPPSGMQIYYKNFDNTLGCLGPSSNQDTTLNVGSTSVDIRETIYASQIISPPPTSGNASFSLATDYGASTTAGSTYNFICPPNDSVTPNLPGPPFFDSSGTVKMDAADFNSSTAKITITGKCSSTTPFPWYIPTGISNAAIFTCTGSGFNAGAATPNQITTNPIPDALVYAGQTYAPGTNPVIDLTTYFSDSTIGNDYRNQNNRTYYSVTIGNATDSQSITQNTSLFNLSLLSNIQMAKTTSADIRAQISSSTNGVLSAIPTLSSDEYASYCTQPANSNYYQCSVTVCACNPAIGSGTTPDSSTNPGYCNNMVNTHSTDHSVSGFTCPVGSKTPPAGTGGPAASTFNLYVMGPEFLAKSVQDIATEDGQAGNSGSNLTRFVVPINPSKTPISEIPLAQYFKNSDGTALASTTTYKIVGVDPQNGSGSYTGSAIATDPAQKDVLPNQYKGNLSSVTGEPKLFDSSTTPGTDNGTNDWSPIKVNYLAASSSLNITPNKDGVTLSIDTSNTSIGPTLKVDASNFRPQGDLNGGLYQITIQGTETGSAGNASGIAYQTIYLNISSKNTSQYSATGASADSNSGAVVYTPMQPFNSAWMYLPGYLNKTAGGGTNPGSASLQSTALPNALEDNSVGICQTGDLNQTPVSADPCVTYSTLLNNLSQSGAPIQALTPDILWIAFQNSGKAYPANTDIPIDNNFFSDSSHHVQQALSFFRSSNPQTLMFLTAELDNPVKGGVDNLSDSGIPGAPNHYSQMDQLVWATALPFTQTCSYTNGSMTASCLPDGLQFDVEPFSASAKSVEYYKRVADILARYGKPISFFAFPNATIPSPQGESTTFLPSLALAMGPLGIILPSTYDVGANTDPKYISTYTQNFMTPSTGGTYIDNNCHWSSAFAYNYLSGTNPNQLPIQGYCNIDLSNTLFNNTTLLGIGTQGAFARIMSIYGGHFQLAVPSSGSAENYTAQVIYNPICVPVDETATDSNTSNTAAFTTPPINTNPYASGSLKDVCPTPSSTTNLVNTIPGLPSNFTEDDTVPAAIQAIFNTAPGSASLDNLNALMPLLRAKLDPKTFYVGVDSVCENNIDGVALPFLPGTTTAETPAQACRYVIYLSNPNNEGNTTAKTYVPADGSTPSQDVYIQAMLDFAQNKNTDYPQDASYPLGNPTNNPSNLGLALYALSSEQVTGCLPGESHAFKQNCLLALPITTPLYDPMGGTAPSGGQYSISNLTISPLTTSSYSLKWTLNCTNPPTAGFLATSQLYNSGNSAPLTRLTSWIDPTKTPITCRSSNTTTFTLSRGSLPSATQVSLALQQAGTFQNMAQPIVINIADNSIAAGLNPVWNDVFNYTNIPLSISKLSVESGATGSSYTLDWTLNCTNPPTAGFLATSQLYNSGNSAPLTRLTSWIDPTKTPITCGSSNTTTFTLSRGSWPSATQVSLTLQQAGTFQNITQPVTTPFNSSSSQN